MGFTKISFIYFFATVAVAAYYAVPKRYGNTAMAILSLIYYAYVGLTGTAVAAVCATVTYVGGILTEKHRHDGQSNVCAAATIGILIAILCLMKYGKASMQPGISFFTFRAISYIADIRRGTPAEKDGDVFIAWFMLFPIMIAGPIVRYDELRGELTDRTASAGDVSDGIARFAVGLFKKTLIADSLYAVCAVYKSQTAPSTLFAWLYAVSYTLYIYYDFSGYSDMAIGLGRIFGFHFPENFDYPYISASISEFWRRWHISLGRWFRDYVYIPLGGSRHGRIRTALSLAAVWILTGMWHGASWNFVIWGAWYGVLIISEKLLYPHFRSHAYTVAAIVTGFVIFDGGTVAGAFTTLGRMIGIGAAPYDPMSLYYLGSNAILLTAAAVGATPIIRRLTRRIKHTAVLRPVAVSASLILSTAYTVSGTFNPFLYSRF